jgi:hypothetical protein
MNAIAMRMRAADALCDSQQTLVPCGFLTRRKKRVAAAEYFGAQRIGAMISPAPASQNDASMRRYHKLFVRRFGVFLLLR